MSELLDDLEKSILLVLSNVYDECGEPGWVRLNDVLLFLDSSSIEGSDEVRELTPGRLVDDVVKVLERAHRDGLIEKSEEGDVQDVTLRITDHGSYVLSDQETFVPEHDSTPPGIDSRRWTGLTLNTEQKDQLVANIDTALSRVEGLELSQDKRAQVRALLLAARTLAEAPEPPLQIIAMLFGNVDRILGVSGLFVGIAGLILTMIV